mgnify:CR=1 FL=1
MMKRPCFHRGANREPGDAQVRFGQETFRLRVPEDTTRLLLLDVPMARWGYPSAKLLWAAADVVWIGNGELALCGEGDGLCLRVNGERVRCHGGETLVLDGQRLSIRHLGWEEAARAKSPFLAVFERPVLPPWRSEAAQAVAWGKPNEPQLRPDQPIAAMESFGCYDGCMTYRFDVPACRYLLLENAADLASLWVEGQYQKSWVSNAGMQRADVRGGQVTLSTEIWGHTCFDECYNPLLYMRSLRGLQGAYAVLEERDIHSNWHFTADEGAFTDTVTPLWSALPCLTQCCNLIPRGYVFAGMYRREITMPSQGDTRLLHFDGLGMNAAVYVNGQRVAEVDTSNPYVDITDCTAPGTAAELIVRARAGSVEALPGTLSLLAA